MRRLRLLQQLPENRRGLVVTCLWFLVILALKYDTLLAPPVWDTAMGVFPPALFLYLNDFDIATLAGLEGWWQGGPNVHSLSLVTWVIAIVMKVTGDPVMTFFVLHTMTFVMAAWGLMVFGRLLHGFVFSSAVSVAACAFVLAFPVVLMQVGYMYTEIPAMVCAIAAADLWRRGRMDAAIGLCIISMFIKFTAVVLALSMILAILIDRNMGIVQKLRRLITLTAALVVARFLPQWLGRPPSGTGWGDHMLLFTQLEARMRAVPDLAWLVILAAIAGLVLAGMGIMRYWRSGQGSANTPVQGALLICILFPGLFCAAIILGVYTQTLLLPRYLVPAVPFALLVFLVTLRSIHFERVSVILLGIAVAYFVINTNGRYYPQNFDSFSVVERSHAYQQFNEVKAAAIDSLSKKPPGVPAWVTR